MFEVKYGDIAAQSEYKREKKLEKLQAVKEIYETVIKQQQCVSLKTLAVTGRDLMEQADMVPGKELGEMLKELLELVVEEPSLNEKEVLLSKARELLEK